MTARRVQLVVRHEAEVDGADCSPTCEHCWRYKGETVVYHCGLFDDVELETPRGPDFKLVIKRCPACLAAESGKVEP